MSEPLRLILAFVLAMAPAALLCRVMMSVRIMDAPTEARKTQRYAVPTSGGVAVAISALLATVVVTELTPWDLDAVIWVTGAGAMAALLLGLADDILTLRASYRLVAVLVLTGLMAAFGARADVLGLWPGVVIALPYALAVIGSMAWLVVVINAVNFMDGANGLAMGMAAIAALGLSICAGFTGQWHLSLLAMTVTGGLAGFLVWNIPGKLFAGDAGAYFAGAILGGLSLEFVRARPDLLFIPPMLLLPFLSDVLMTLAWRSMKGKQLFAAHRDHTYQIAIKAGLHHWQVALVHAFWAVNAAVVAVAATILGGQMPAIAFGALALVSVWIHWRVRRSGVAAGLVGADIA
jgi:UDP-N-acetylmuramyl pentapeptide phosphotransferase/UDP-N-acetylglucosamine-1-phosphate transferase